MDDRGSVQRWRQMLRDGRAQLREQYFAHPQAVILLRRQCRLVDTVLRAMWQAFEMPRSLALVAVGGYGRGELYPYSDVDVLILRRDGESTELDSAISRFVGALWDIGLEVGHSARTLSECTTEMRADVTVRTTLLENRQLAGNRSLVRALRTVLSADLDVRAFYDAKVLEQQQRYVRYHDLSSNLEPNLKESPGGLRDLQTVLWIARAAGLGTRWRQLVTHELLTPGECQHVARAERVLQHLRIRLHYVAARREDRLVFDLQNQLATSLGFVDNKQKRASEQLMQRYYRAAKAIRQSNVFLLQELHARLFPVDPVPHLIDENFQAVNELLDIRSDDTFELNPSAILASFLVMERHPELKGMSSRTLRALWQARPRIDARYRRDPVNRALFMQILREPRGITHELRRMNQYGILGRYLPAFGRIVGQMQHDLFHVYTVDEHILMVVRNLRRFTEPQHAHEYPLCSRLMADFAHKELLYLAGIFHDIGKGRGGDHSSLGAVDACHFCEKHGLSRVDASLVVWLVEQHLLMSATAQKQDISDPEVVRLFAAHVKTERSLIALYLLTVADIRGTSPKVWNGWKAKLLEDLFHATRRVVTGDSTGSTQHDSLAERQGEALRILRTYGLRDDAHKAFWNQLDPMYFQRHSAEEIAWHTRLLYYRTHTDVPVVKARPSKAEEGVQLCIYMRDQPNLFARICGFFGKMQFSIVDAKIYTTRNQHALDTFTVLDPENRPASYRDLTSYVEYELTQRLSADAPMDPIVPGRISRRLKAFPITPEVQIFPDDKGSQFILELIAGDRPGLLASIADILARHNINVHNARINTLGERAEDVFLVSGPRLHDESALVRLETALLQALRMEQSAGPTLRAEHAA
ncbi:MAG: [protein-PII] uridylyltransferase [Casimicrobiaceae bacterium]